MEVALMTSKERTELKRQAMALEPIIQIGKDGISEALALTATQAIKNRELIKVSVLDNSGEDTRKVANDLANMIGAEIVQVIGKRFVLYKHNTQKKKK